LVDTVVHTPFGAHPGGLEGRYGPDKAHMQRYVAASRDDESFAEYLRTHVHAVGNHEEYIRRFVPGEWMQSARVA
jgi:glutaconate CoA-transferase subunit A